MDHRGAPAAFASGGAAYAIADRTTDRLLGTVGLSNPVLNRQQAEIGYWIAPWARGRGVATAATRALAERAFATGTARLELFTDPENIASQRVALAAGFHHEGVRRGGGPARDGGRRDLIGWARLAGDPPGPAPRLLPDLPGGRLTDGVVTLRPLGPHDADLMHGLHTLPEVVAARVPPEPLSRTAAEQSCRQALSRWLSGQAASLAILDAASGSAAGTCALVYDSPATRQAMVGYSLLPDWRGRGYATRTVRLLAGWGFADVGLERIWAGTHVGNTASERVLERAGFHRVGVERGRLPGPGGTRADTRLFDLLPGELEG